MNSDVDICWSRTVLCALQTGGKYFGELVKNRCENTVQKSFRNVLNDYKHYILHLWRNDRCCMCGIKKRSSVRTLSQDQIKLIYSISDETCGGTAPCEVCPKSYNAKDGVCTSQLDITFSHALLKGIFLKFVQNKPDLEKVRDAVDEIKNIRNELVHNTKDSHKINLDEKWLKLKENLSVICVFLKEPVGKLEEEMEQYHYIFNDCRRCSAVITNFLEGKEVLNGRINVCSECAELQQTLPDAKDVIFHNLHLFLGIAPFEFLPELYEANVITKDEKDKIFSKGKRWEQMIAFISILKEKGLASCRKTLDILSAMDYGPAIREMRRKRVSDSKIILCGYGDPDDTDGCELFTRDDKATMTISILSNEKDICERELVETITSDDSVSELKSMGPKDVSIGKGSVIINLTFECREDYNRFCVEIKAGNVYDYLSRLWDKTKHKKVITDEEANMVVHIQCLKGSSSHVENQEAPSRDFADSFIDENNDFLIEEMSPGTLINYLKMEGHQIDEVLKIRKENPFDRRSQAKKLLNFFRKTPLSFFRDCMFATQTDIIKDKVNDFFLSVGENSFAEDSRAYKEAFEVTPDGTKFSLKGDDEITLEFEENSVQRKTEMKFKTSSRQFSCKMATGNKGPKRTLNFKAGKELCAEPEEEEHIESSDEEHYNMEDIDYAKNWMPIGNGNEVYTPSMRDNSTEITTTILTNERRAHEEIHLPEPSLFVTDIFRICKSPGLEEATLVASNQDGFNKVSIRVEKPAKFIMNREYKFLAKVKTGSHWKTCSLTYKGDKFWFRAKKLSSFFIYASPLDERFNVFPSGTTFSPEFNQNVQLVFPKNTVNKEERMAIKVWPTCEEQLLVVDRRGEEKRITAMSDTLIVEHKAPKLHHPIQITLPMHGNTEVKSGENVFFFSKKRDSSDLYFERLNTGEFSCHDGKIKATKNIRGGRSHGFVKTKAKKVRIHELLELSKNGYLCQFLYFKLPGGNESSFELWVECAQKYEVSEVRKRNREQHMVEFPLSCSDDIPVLDQEHMTVTITGAVKIRGYKKMSKPIPVYMKFLAVSETTHTRVALVKDQKIDGAYYADIDIAFAWPRGRRSIRSQVDPWGRIMLMKDPHSMAASSIHTPGSTENKCFEERSLQALALAVPPEKVKMLGRFLCMKNNVIDGLFAENHRNISEFAIRMLIHWNYSSKSHDRCKELVEALGELELEELSSVVEAKYANNEIMKSSDFQS